MHVVNYGLITRWFYVTASGCAIYVVGNHYLIGISLGHSQ